MLRVLLDTNVLVSALVKRGKPRQLLRALRVKRISIVISKQIIEEFAEVTAHPKIRRYVDRDDIASFLAFVSSVAAYAEVRSRFKVVKEDPKDDVIVRAAYDGRVSYIVSGDRHLLRIRNFRGIKIVTVNEMLRLLRQLGE